MSARPSVATTIGLPVYNAEATLERTLEHLVAQDHDDLSVIISDNASTDRTVELCNDIVGADARFRVDRHESNGGWQANFRYVLAAAETPLFMWIGADDRIGATYVSQNAAVLAERPDLVSCVSRARWLHDGVPGQEAPGTDPLLGGIADNVEAYLRNARDNSRFYGVHRTEALRASFPEENFFGLDLAIMAGTLRFGGHGRVEDELLWRERTDPSTYVRHIERDADGFVDRALPLLGLTRSLRSMGVPLTSSARRWLLTRNVYEHVRYWSSTDTPYGKVGRAVMPAADRLRIRLVAQPA